MAIPDTTVRSSHAITVRSNGITIGLIQSWNPTQNRTVTPVYQLRADSQEGTGNVYEQVAGNIGGLTITVNRFDLYNKLMEDAWGPNFTMQMLTDQSTGLEVRERWANPDGSSLNVIYKHCWFTSLGRTMSATDARIVNVNASLSYTSMTRA